MTYHSSSWVPRRFEDMEKSIEDFKPEAKRLMA